MIRNERQYEQTNAAAARFRDAIEKLQAEPATKKRDVAIAGARAQLRPLEEELRAYEKLRASGGTDLDGRLEDLGALLTQARIARGWYQKDLAKKLGVTTGTIERYEKSDWDTASLLTVCDAARILGLESRLTAKMIRLEAFAPLPARSKVAGKARAK